MTTTVLPTTTSPGDESTTTTIREGADREEDDDTTPGWMWFLVGGLGLAVALMPGFTIGRRGAPAAADSE